jgi:hypothetical protein
MIAVRSFDFLVSINLNTAWNLANDCHYYQKEGSLNDITKMLKRHGVKAINKGGFRGMNLQNARWLLENILERLDQEIWN